ncbi:MAG: GrpB family protein [Holosporaceae bacterium]|jgi:GrpB-like predicted nucleotidyltransferase (UPF0157 family)|nr:GrpB family protein [Holosporaceae bacterium]
MHKIDVVPYNPDWPQIFEVEREIIAETLGDNCVTIHHIGSTAVHGLAAKPKIDIIIVAKERESVIANLEKAEYCYRGEWNVPLKCGFTKRGNININLHVFFEKDHPEIELNLLFRDYLRTHSDICDEYAALKTKILQDESSQEKIGILPAYTIKKRCFIDDIIRRTGFNRLRVLKCATDNEWIAVKNFRQKYFDERKKPDPCGEISAPNHEHFMLYRGVEIIGYAHIQIYPKSSEARLHMVVFTDEKDKLSYCSYFLSTIEKWTMVHGYKF